MRIKSAVQWFPGVKASGIIEIPPSHVDQSAARGIVFDRPGGTFAVTWMGNIQLAYGDWVVTMDSGNRYVFKQPDYYLRMFEKRSLWQKIKGIFIS